MLICILRMRVRPEERRPEHVLWVLISPGTVAEPWEEVELRLSPPDRPVLPREVMPGITGR
jgi:hypothetical protein